MNHQQKISPWNQVDSLRPIGISARLVLLDAKLRSVLSSPSRRQAEVFLAEVTRRRAVVIAIADWCHNDRGELDEVVTDRILFPQSALPRLHAHFKLRPLAGAPGHGPREFVVDGVQS